MVLTECWFSCAKSIPTLDDYNHAVTSSHKTQNEGVVIYYSKLLNPTFEEPSVTDASCLVLKLDTDTCIIGLFRPPSQTNTVGFVDSINSLLNQFKSFKIIFLCGDININIVPNSPDKRSHDYLNTLTSHGLLSSHTSPTCLDHMMI